MRAPFCVTEGGKYNYHFASNDYTLRELKPVPISNLIYYDVYEKKIYSSHILMWKRKRT